MAKETAIWQVQETYREVLHDLVNQKESAIVDGHLMADIHMCSSSTNKLPRQQAVGVVYLPLIKIQKRRHSE